MKTEEKLEQASEQFVRSISEAELACRMAEASAEVERPSGLSPDECLAILDKDVAQAMLRAARAAMLYWQECIQSAQRTN